MCWGDGVCVSARDWMDVRRGWRLGYETASVSGWKGGVGLMDGLWMVGGVSRCARSREFLLR